MPTTSTAGVYLLAAEHADALARFAADATFAALTGIAHPVVSDAAAFVDRTAAERTAGASFWSAIVDRGDVKGVAAVIGAYGDDPRVEVWIDPAARRRGYGELALRMTVEFSFRNLQLQRIAVLAGESDPACSALPTKSGFERTVVPHDLPNALARWSVTQKQWVAQRDRPAIAALHPDLRTILDAELAAGNEVAETGGGWPDADSIFIRLRDPFRTTPTPLPDGVTYTEPNDPHWWKADYSSRAPRHVLAC